MDNYYCYLLFSNSKNRTYIGITNNIKKRLSQHNNHKGAKATRIANDWIVYKIVGIFNKQNAASFEWYWKNQLYNNKWIKTKSGLSNKINRLNNLLNEDKWKNMNEQNIESFMF